MTKKIQISNFKYQIFIGVIFVALFLRIYQLSNVPPSASLDEASIGWNAYSILKTGADEYGTKFPILLRAYDDWRPALYVYLVIPFIAILDLNVVAVRLPSVILSALTVVAMYFLVKELFRLNPKSEIRNPKQYQNFQASPDQNTKYLKFDPFDKLRTRIGNLKLEIPTIAAAMLAISPWHIYISRLGHEANAGLAFTIFGILFFFKAKNFNMVQYYSKKIYVFFILSMMFFSLSFYTYQSTKVFVPLFMLVLVILYRKELLKIKKYFLLSLIVFIILTLPIFFASFSPNALARFSGVNVFNNHPLYGVNAVKFARAKESGDIIGQITNHRQITSLYIFTNQYLSHFSLEWLFGNGGNEPFKAPNVGLFYYWQLPFIIIGILVLILSKKFIGKTKVLIILWIIFSFIAPSITTEVPHAMRSYNALPALIFVMSLGLVEGLSMINTGFIKSLFEKCHSERRDAPVGASRSREISITQRLLNKIPPRTRFTRLVGMTRGKILKILIFLITLIAILELINFSRSYFILFPKEQSDSFKYALSRAIPFVLDNERAYSKIVFSNQDNLYQSYMVFLFYSKYDPNLYQKQGGTKSGGFAETHAFGKYEFRPIKWEQEAAKENSLYIGNSFDFPKDLPFTGINYLDDILGIKTVGKHE